MAFLISTRLRLLSGGTRILGVLSLAVVLLAGVPAHGETIRGETARQTVEARGFDMVNVGFLVEDAETGARLAGWQDDRPFIPASVTKLWTAIAALETLGPAYRFSTEIRASTPIDGDGALYGDLMLVGGGDPRLVQGDIADMAAGLAASGLTTVRGRFLYDDTALPRIRAIEPTQPLTEAYNASIAGLAIDFNRQLFYWTTKGGVLRLGLRPDYGIAGYGVSAVSFPDGGTIGIGRTRDGGAGWLLAPGSPPSGSDWVPVLDPGRYAARALQRMVLGQGIELPEPTPGRAHSNAIALVRHQSPPLGEIIEDMLRYSNNYVAEVVGLHTARWLGSRDPTLRRTARWVTGWLQGGFPETDWAGFEVFNHSGLSSAAGANAAQVMTFLRFGMGRTYDGRPFSTFLRPARWADDKTAPVQVSGKSGTMNYARGYAGWFTGVSGRRRLFVLFIDDRTARAAFEADPRRRRPEAQARARLWINRALKLEQTLIRGWVRKF